MRVRMTLLSKIGMFFTVSVNRESCRGFLDRISGVYFPVSLLPLFLVQLSQILNPQVIETVWRWLQLLHSRVTASVPQFSNRLAKNGLNSLRFSAIESPNSLSYTWSLSLHELDKFYNNFNNFSILFSLLKINQDLWGDNISIIK